MLTVYRRQLTRFWKPMSLSVEKLKSLGFTHQVCGAAQACVFWRGLELHCALESVSILGSQRYAVAIHAHRLGKLYPQNRQAQLHWNPQMLIVRFRSLPSDRPHATLQKPGYFLWLWIRGWGFGDQQRLGNLPALPLFGEQPSCGENPHDRHLQKLHLQCVGSSAPGS